MAGSSATASIKTLIVILSLAAMPAVAFAQGSGGAAGSTSGVANSSAPPPGTNSLGTAQSSGANASPGMTTGTGPGGADAAVAKENKLLDTKMKSICRGC